MFLIVIPAYKPVEKLLQIIDDIQTTMETQIIVVLDGEADKEIDAALRKKEVIVLKHAINLGKGRALKTAFNYILSFCIGGGDEAVVTVDADGQHTIKSIQNCMDHYLKWKRKKKEKKVVLLGARNFGKEKNIPLRSKIGNQITRMVFSFLCGLDISDTQTGLRVIDMQLLPVLMTICGERYEYETNMLLELNTMPEVVVCQTEIETIYLDGNSSSHFNPLKDSLAIYKRILLYSLSSILSVIVDYGILFLLYPYISNIMLLTYLGRSGAAILNYTLNKKMVFEYQGCYTHTFLKYIILLFVSGTISGIGIYIYYIFIFSGI